MQTGQEKINPWIIWGALSISVLFYGLILFILGKMSYFTLPEGQLKPLEIAAMAMNLLLGFTLFFHKTQIEPEKNADQKFRKYILCWALHESIVVIAFVATFLSDSGNGFFYVSNLAIGLLGNFLTRPHN